MKKVSLILILILMIASCKKEKETKKELFTLNANLTNVSDGTLFSLKNLKTNTIIDSAHVVNGNLSLIASLKSEHPEKLFLSAKDSISNEFIYTFLFVENEQVTFNADKEDFPWNIDVSGSIHQDIAEKFNQKMYQKQEIVKRLKHVHKSNKELLSKKLSHVSDSLDNTIIKLIKEEFNSYAALDNFKYHKTQFSSEELNKLYNLLDPRLRETLQAKAIKLQSQHPKPEVGDSYYDFSAINQHGETVTLSQIKDKYILLHFSFAACYYSQLSLPELRKIYKAHGDALEIISISEDFDRKHWLEQVERDSISWSFLWDGKGEFGDAVVKYWEKGVPNYVLISPDKIILEKWNGYKNGIFEEKIVKYFNRK